MPKKRVYVVLENGKPLIFERYPDVIMVACYTSKRKARASVGDVRKQSGRKYTIVPVKINPKKAI